MLHTSPPNEGARELGELGISQRKIAVALGLSHETIRRWATGRSTPEHGIRLKIAELFGVAAEAWDRAPGAEAPRTAAESLAQRISAHQAVAASNAPLPNDADGLDSVISQVREARRVPGIAPATLARLAAIEVRAVEARERVRSIYEQAQRDPRVHEVHGQMLEAVWGSPLTELAMLRIYLQHFEPARLEEFDRDVAAWREQHRDLVEAAEAANAALAAANPPNSPFPRAAK